MVTDSDVQRIADRLGKAEQIKDYWRCLCPVHNDTNPSLDLKQDNGKFLYKCRAGCSQDEVGKELRRRFPEFFKGSEKTSSRHRQQEKRRMSNEELVRKLWRASLPVKDTPVETYLKQRMPAINAEQIPACLKYLPQAYHSQEKKKLRCLVAPFTIYPSHDVHSISRTYLNDKGTDKANADPPKSMLGAVNGGAIVLDYPKERLGIAEGLESALSVREIVKGQIPIWATGTATNLSNLQLPPKPSASEVIFFCDYDDAGLKAVLSRAETARKEGRSVKILRPVSPFVDWNDAYVDAVKNASEMSLESLSEVVHEEEELKRLGLDKDKLEKENTAEDYQNALRGLDDDVAIAKHIFRHLQKQHGELIYSEGDLWAYPQKATHWKPFTHEYLVRRIQGYSGRLNITLKGKESYIKLGESRIKSILIQLYALKKVPPDQDIFFSDFDHCKVGINCLNGFLKIETDGRFSLITHDKTHRQRFTIPFNFNPELLTSLFNEECTLWRNSLLKKLLEGCFKDDRDKTQKIDFLMQVMGNTSANYALKLRQPKAVIFYGDTAENGKSQMLDMIGSFLSSADVCSSDPEGFGDEKRRLTLKNKKLNLVYELSGNAIQSSHTKQIITGDTIDARELYKMPINFRCTAQHIWATNKLPSFFGGMDRGVQRRMGVLSFNRVIPAKEKIVDIGKQIAKTEGELLLAFAICGAIKVIKNGDYVFPPSSLDVMEQWKGEADPVLGFIQECVDVDPSNSLTPSQTIYDYFIEYGRRSGLRIDKLPALKGFIQRFKNNLPEGIVYKKTETYRGFTSLKLINNQDISGNDKVIPIRSYSK